MADDINLSFTEKTTGRWREVYKEFVGNSDRMMQALKTPGAHVPSPLNLASKKDGFRLDKDYEQKNGLAFDNSLPGSPAISGVKIISFLTGLDEKRIASDIHKFIDGKVLDIIQIRANIEEQTITRENQDLEKIEFNRNMIKDILHKPIDNSFRDKYLETRGLEKAIPFISDDIRGIAELQYYHNKEKTNLPAMVSIVRNEDNKIAFLHRTYLDQNGNKANFDDAKKVTGKTREDAYHRPFFTQVNNPKKNHGANIHICEGIETALAVAVITGNKDQVISAINAHGITRFEPPPHVKNVEIWADYDIKGMQSAISLQNKIGSQVHATINLPSQQGRDFLDDLNNNIKTSVKHRGKNQNRGFSR